MKSAETMSERKIGKTIQFWVLYLDLMRLQHQIPTAVQTNKFNMRLDAWDKTLPMYFAFNKTNYARYGTWFVQTMKEIDDRYPGVKPLLQSNDLSVQVQTAYPIRTSIDQRGEHSINRDAKTPGNFWLCIYYQTFMILMSLKGSSVNPLILRQIDCVT